MTECVIRQLRFNRVRQTMSEYRFQAVLADLDGTVYRGDSLIPGVDSLYRDLTDKGYRWLFLSNNATATASDLAAKLRSLGLPVSGDQVMNSASALIRALKKERPQARVFLVGESKLRAGIELAGIEIVDDASNVDIVVGAMDRGFTYAKLEKAQGAILNGAAFWATNTDASFPVAHGLLPGAGSIIASIATAAGRQPDRIFGKPSTDFAEMALQVLGMGRDACLVVGDRLETDILFAQNAEMASALVLTGASSREDLMRFSFSPDYVLESIVQISEILLDGRPR